MSIDFIYKYWYSYSFVSSFSIGDFSQLSNIGKGTGYYISNGVAVKINWEKTSRDAKTVYTYEDGTPLKVNDGNTFIQIQPKNQTLKIEGSTD